MFESTPINPIEQVYRTLVAENRAPRKMFVGLPGEHGIHFPSELLEAHYAPYCCTSTYAPDAQGLLTTREAIAGYYAEHAWEISPTNIVCTCGTSESFFYLCALLCAPGDTLLVPTPSYPLYNEIAQIAHVELATYPLTLVNGRWAVDCDALAAAITLRTKAIVIVSPHNPTGMVCDAATLAQIAKIAQKNNLAVICDEVFADFLHDPQAKFPRLAALAPDVRCFTLNGISKMLALPNLKLAWIAMSGAAAQVTADIDRLSFIADTFLPVHEPIQRAFPALFAHSENFRREFQTTVRARTNAWIELLSRQQNIVVPTPAGGWYLAMHLTNGPEDEDFLIQTFMREHGLFFHPGYFYDFPDAPWLIVSTLTATDGVADVLQGITS